MTTGFDCRPRSYRCLFWVALGSCALLVGCKSSSKDKGGLFSSRPGPDGALTSRNDPLLGGARIPPQNLPVPGKDGYSARERKDPLLGTPNPKDRPPERAGGTDKPKDGNVSAPAKSGKEIFRPDAGTTPAALAAGSRLPADDRDLSIGDRRPTIIPASGRSAPVELKPTSDPAFDKVAGDLKRLGAKIGDPEREGTKFVVRAEVPLDPNNPGRLRWYEGVGTTAAAAAKQILDQVNQDRVK